MMKFQQTKEPVPTTSTDSTAADASGAIASSSGVAPATPPDQLVEIISFFQDVLAKFANKDFALPDYFNTLRANITAEQLLCMAATLTHPALDKLDVIKDKDRRKQISSFVTERDNRKKISGYVIQLYSAAQELATEVKALIALVWENDDLRNDIFSNKDKETLFAIFLKQLVVDSFAGRMIADDDAFYGKYVKLQEQGKEKEQPVVIQSIYLRGRAALESAIGKGKDVKYCMQKALPAFFSDDTPDQSNKDNCIARSPEILALVTSCKKYWKLVEDGISEQVRRQKNQTADALWKKLEDASLFVKARRSGKTLSQYVRENVGLLKTLLPQADGDPAVEVMKECACEVLFSECIQEEREDFIRAYDALYYFDGSEQLPNVDAPARQEEEEAASSSDVKKLSQENRISVLQSFQKYYENELPYQFGRIYTWEQLCSILGELTFKQNDNLALGTSEEKDQDLISVAESTEPTENNEVQFDDLDSWQMMMELLTAYKKTDPTFLLNVFTEGAKTLVAAQEEKISAPSSAEQPLLEVNLEPQDCSANYYAKRLEDKLVNALKMDPKKYLPYFLNLYNGNLIAHDEDSQKTFFKALQDIVIHKPEVASYFLRKGVAKKFSAMCSKNLWENTSGDLNNDPVYLLYKKRGPIFLMSCLQNPELQLSGCVSPQMLHKILCERSEKEKEAQKEDFVVLAKFALQDPALTAAIQEGRNGAQPWTFEQGIEFYKHYSDCLSILSLPHVLPIRLENKADAMYQKYFASGCDKTIIESALKRTQLEDARMVQTFEYAIMLIKLIKNLALQPSAQSAATFQIIKPDEESAPSLEQLDSSVSSENMDLVTSIENYRAAHLSTTDDPELISIEVAKQWLKDISREYRELGLSIKEDEELGQQEKLDALQQRVTILCANFQAQAQEDLSHIEQFVKQNKVTFLLLYYFSQGFQANNQNQLQNYFFTLFTLDDFGRSQQNVDEFISSIGEDKKSLLKDKKMITSFLDEKNIFAMFARASAKDAFLKLFEYFIDYAPNKLEAIFVLVQEKLNKGAGVGQEVDESGRAETSVSEEDRSSLISRSEITSEIDGRSSRASTVDSSGDGGSRRASIAGPSGLLPVQAEDLEIKIKDQAFVYISHAISENWIGEKIDSYPHYFLRAPNFCESFISRENPLRIISWQTADEVMKLIGEPIKELSSAHIYHLFRLVNDYNNFKTIICWLEKIQRLDLLTDERNVFSLLNRRTKPLWDREVIGENIWHREAARNLAEKQLDFALLQKDIWVLMTYPEICKQLFSHRLGELFYSLSLLLSKLQPDSGAPLSLKEFFNSQPWIVKGEYLLSLAGMLCHPQWDKMPQEHRGQIEKFILDSAHSQVLRDYVKEKITSQESAQETKLFIELIWQHEKIRDQVFPPLRNIPLSGKMIANGLDVYPQIQKANKKAPGDRNGAKPYDSQLSSVYVRGREELRKKYNNEDKPLKHTIDVLTFIFQSSEDLGWLRQHPEVCVFIAGDKQCWDQLDEFLRKNKINDAAAKESYFAKLAAVSPFFAARLNAATFAEYVCETPQILNVLLNPERQNAPQQTTVAGQSTAAQVSAEAPATASSSAASRFKDCAYEILIEESTNEELSIILEKVLNFAMEPRVKQRTDIFVPQELKEKSFDELACIYKDSTFKKGYALAEAVNIMTALDDEAFCREFTDKSTNREFKLKVALANPTLANRLIKLMREHFSEEVVRAIHDHLSHLSPTEEHDFDPQVIAILFILFAEATKNRFVKISLDKKLQVFHSENFNNVTLHSHSSFCIALLKDILNSDSLELLSTTDLIATALLYFFNENKDVIKLEQKKHLSNNYSMLQNAEKFLPIWQNKYRTLLGEILAKHVAIAQKVLELCLIKPEVRPRTPADLEEECVDAEQNLSVSAARQTNLSVGYDVGDLAIIRRNTDLFMAYLNELAAGTASSVDASAVARLSNLLFALIKSEITEFFDVINHICCNNRQLLLTILGKKDCDNKDMNILEASIGRLIAVLANPSEVRPKPEIMVKILTWIDSEQKLQRTTIDNAFCHNPQLTADLFASECADMVDTAFINNHELLFEFLLAVNFPVIQIPGEALLKLITTKNSALIMLMFVSAPHLLTLIKYFEQQDQPKPEAFNDNIVMTLCRIAAGDSSEFLKNPQIVDVCSAAIGEILYRVNDKAANAEEVQDLNKQFRPVLSRLFISEDRKQLFKGKWNDTTLEWFLLSSEEKKEEERVKENKVVKTLLSESFIKEIIDDSSEAKLAMGRLLLHHPDKVFSKIASENDAKYIINNFRNVIETLLTSFLMGSLLEAEGKFYNAVLADQQLCQKCCLSLVLYFKKCLQKGQLNNEKLLKSEYEHLTNIFELAHATLKQEISPICATTARPVSSVSNIRALNYAQNIKTAGNILGKDQAQSSPIYANVKNLYANANSDNSDGKLSRIIQSYIRGIFDGCLVKTQPSDVVRTVISPKVLHPALLLNNNIRDTWFRLATDPHPFADGSIKPIVREIPNVDKKNSDECKAAISKYFVALLNEQIYQTLSEDVRKNCVQLVFAIIAQWLTSGELSLVKDILQAIISNPQSFKESCAAENVAILFDVLRNQSIQSNMRDDRSENFAQLKLLVINQMLADSQRQEANIKLCAQWINEITDNYPSLLSQLTNISLHILRQLINLSNEINNDKFVFYWLTQDRYVNALSAEEVQEVVGEDRLRQMLVISSEQLNRKFKGEENGKVLTGYRKNIANIESRLQRAKSNMRLPDSSDATAVPAELVIPVGEPPAPPPRTPEYTDDSSVLARGAPPPPPRTESSLLARGALLHSPRPLPSGEASRSGAAPSIPLVTPEASLAQSNSAALLAAIITYGKNKPTEKEHSKHKGGIGVGFFSGSELQTSKTVNKKSPTKLPSDFALTIINTKLYGPDKIATLKELAETNATTGVNGSKKPLVQLFILYSIDDTDREPSSSASAPRNLTLSIQGKSSSDKWVQIKLDGEKSMHKSICNNIKLLIGSGKIPTDREALQIKHEVGIGFGDFTNIVNETAGLLHYTVDSSLQTTLEAGLERIRGAYVEKEEENNGDWENSLSPAPK